MLDLSKLVVRAKVVQRIRSFFETRDFLEVETPVQIAAPAPEVHIDCPQVMGTTPSFLRASPELQMKKLLAQGLDRIWQMGPCFRAGECGSRHNPEFTMLEWYRANADYLDILQDMEELIRTTLRGTAWEDKVVMPFKRLTVQTAYQTLADWDPFEGEWDQDRFDYDMATKIEPQLPQEPTFLIDYPIQAASLAKIRDGVAERWELYIGGMELANAFTELIDAKEQRSRFELARFERRRLGEADYPLDENFLNLLPLMRPSGGVALGVDRLVMLAAGAREISEIRVLR